MKRERREGRRVARKGEGREEIRKNEEEKMGRREK